MMFVRVFSRSIEFDYCRNKKGWWSGEDEEEQEDVWDERKEKKMLWQRTTNSVSIWIMSTY